MVGAEGITMAANTQLTYPTKGISSITINKYPADWCCMIGHVTQITMMQINEN